MSSRPNAQYLLRFDDLCPTMDRERWARIEELVEYYELKPILAVVPDNRDPELVRDEYDHGFWLKIRQMEATGAAVGLHGYQHLCLARGKSCMPIHRESEFAGVPYEQQAAWIRMGLSILRSHSLNPRIWVAPRHGLDAMTCRALKEIGIDIVSDGWARRPFRRFGLTWIPQQLWRPVEKSEGLWTICMHPNTATDEEIEALRSFLESRATQFTSVSQVLREWQPAGRTVADRWFHSRTQAVGKVRNLLR